MQVLKNSKVTFVSAVGLCLLTNFWIISSFLTAPGLTVLLLKEKKKSPADFKPSSQFCGSSQILQAEGGWAPVFFLSRGSPRMGAQSALQ